MSESSDAGFQFDKALAQLQDSWSSVFRTALPNGPDKDIPDLQRSTLQFFAAFAEPLQVFVESQRELSNRITQWAESQRELAEIAAAWAESQRKLSQALSTWAGLAARPDRTQT